MPVVAILWLTYPSYKMATPHLMLAYQTPSPPLMECLKGLISVTKHTNSFAVYRKLLPTGHWGRCIEDNAARHEAVRVLDHKICCSLATG